MDERQERLGRNEALFREINERLEGLNETFSAVSERIEVVCECGQSSCIERFSMSVREYEALRRDPTTFAIRPGHEIADVETVVERGAEYVVVRKHAGEPAKLAANEDARS